MVSPRHMLLRLWRQGLAASDPLEATSAHIRSVFGQGHLGGDRPIICVAVGKAAPAMARGAQEALGERLYKGLMITISELAQSSDLPPSWHIMPSDHPQATRRSEQAANAIRDLIKGSGQEVLFLVSGGASALVAKAKAGITLAQKNRAVAQAMASGASIHELNRLRQSLSAVKAGRILQGVRTPVLSLIISDVIGDDLRIIGSGLTVPARGRKNVENRLLMPCGQVAREIAKIARRKGHPVHMSGSPLQGQARLAGKAWAERILKSHKPGLWVCHGETTSKIQGPGRGGRNLEFALGACEALRGSRGVTIASLGTDGIDGNSGAAGAIVDHQSWSKMLRVGLDPEVLWRKSDTRELFERSSDLVVSGGTGCNFADIQLAWVKG